jgi:hypothetical protein
MDGNAPVTGYVNTTAGHGILERNAVNADCCCRRGILDWQANNGKYITVWKARRRLNKTVIFWR